MTEEEAKANFLGVLPEARSEVLYDLLILQSKRIDELYNAYPVLANQCAGAINKLAQDVSQALNQMGGAIGELQTKLEPPKPEEKGLLLLP